MGAKRRGVVEAREWGLAFVVVGGRGHARVRAVEAHERGLANKSRPGKPLEDLVLESRNYSFVLGFLGRAWEQLRGC